MRIATWNVNSIRVREEKLLAWLEAWDPDVLCLQETKVVDGAFPRAPLEAAGWTCSTYGQKTYNGVAIVTKAPQTDVVRGFADGEDEDPQARIIRATVGGVRVVDVYVPNGKAVGDEKYVYKLGWMERLRRALAAQEDVSGPFVLLGDFNVAPADIDVHDPAKWEGSVHCSDAERAALAGWRDLGLTDVFRRLHPDLEGAFSWWDYRRLAFQKRQGLRIDLVLASDPLTERLTECVIDKDARRGKGTSDHAPVVADFADV